MAMVVRESTVFSQPPGQIVPYQPAPTNYQPTYARGTNTVITQARSGRTMPGNTHDAARSVPERTDYSGGNRSVLHLGNMKPLYGQPNGAMVPYQEKAQPEDVPRMPDHGALVPFNQQGQDIQIVQDQQLVQAPPSLVGHMAPKMHGQIPNMYGAVADPVTPLAKTSMGDIILISDSRQGLDHVNLALLPVLEVYNTHRYKQGLKPIGLERKLVGARSQNLGIDHQHHLVIFVSTTTHIHSLCNPAEGNDFKKAFRQCRNGKNEILYFLVGDLALARMNTRGYQMGYSPDHNELYDRIIADTGIFNGCQALPTKMRAGELFSFTTDLNHAQKNQLNRILDTVQGRCKVDDRKDDGIKFANFTYG